MAARLKIAVDGQKKIAARLGGDLFYICKLGINHPLHQTEQSVLWVSIGYEEALAYRKAKGQYLRPSQWEYLHGQVFI